MAQTLAELIKGYRLSKGLTQKELAEAVGATKGYIAALEQGVRLKPRESVLRKLSSALELTQDESKNLMLAAQGAKIPFSAGKAPSSPLFKLLEQVLVARPDSNVKAERLEAFYKCLSAALAAQGASVSVRKKNQSLALVTKGYAYAPPGESREKGSSPPEKLTRLLKDRKDTAVSLSALLDILLDAKISPQKQAALAKELLSLARWRCHGHSKDEQKKGPEKT